jgi:nicotinate-nucleotide adenylyltransferase
MQPSKRAIGILGGTFDPIHFGHLRLALELHQAFDLESIQLIPCFQPVHRKQPVASPEERLSMVKRAIASEPALEVDDCEIKRKGPSYTIDTLIELRKKNPQSPFCILIGIDAFLGFTSWHRWQDILDQAHLIVAHRPHYHLPHTGIVAKLMRDRLTEDTNIIHKKMQGCILLHPITALEVSATDIRKQIAMGKNPRYLLPDNVYEFIKKRGIYSVSTL